MKSIPKKRNILLVIAAINVYGLKLYSKSYANIDCGKNNITSVLQHRVKKSTIRTVFRYIKTEGLFTQETSDVGGLISMTRSRNMIKLFVDYLL
jgi:hypothetical protein